MTVLMLIQPYLSRKVIFGRIIPIAILLPALSFSAQAKNCKDDQNLTCKNLSQEESRKYWLQASMQAKGFKERKVLKFLAHSKSSKSRLLATYLHNTKLKKPLRIRKHFRIQTGKYSGVTLASNPLSGRCFSEVLKSAYLLQTELPEFNFEIDGEISRCSRLRKGVRDLVKNKAQVAQNLKHIHSPLHTIYLTTETKFNNHTLGKMGLYVNVERRGEIKSRLIDFHISQEQIRHEKKPRLGGLSSKK